MDTGEKETIVKNARKATNLDCIKEEDTYRSSKSSENDEDLYFQDDIEIKTKPIEF